jgi:hypothetical protein
MLPLLLCELNRLYFHPNVQLVEVFLFGWFALRSVALGLKHTALAAVM